MAVVLFDTETGEIHDKEIYSYTTVKQHEAQLEYAGIKSKNTKFEQYGSFVWFVYNPLEKIFPELNNAEIARLIFLSTYVDYDTNYLCSSKSNYLKTERISKLLHICYKKTQLFLAKLIKLEILEKEEGKYKMNSKIFYKGQIKDNYGADKETIRIYIKFIRTLFNTCTPRQHNKLAYFYKLIPYINRKYNVVCSNIFETEMEYINIMTLEQICDVLDYDKSNISKLIKELSKIEYGDEHVFCYMAAGDIKKATIFINPVVFYSGSDNEVISLLRGFFSKNPTF